MFVIKMPAAKFCGLKKAPIGYMMGLMSNDIPVATSCLRSNNAFLLEAEK